jgi:flagellar basal-body rod protein FlgB
MPLFDKTIDALSRSLDLHLMRHAVISDNIANAETPGFKSRRVDFENELQKAVDASDINTATRTIASVNPVIYEDYQSETGQDLNGVDMDREMSALTKNDIKYSAASQAISKKFALLKYAIGSEEK